MKFKNLGPGEQFLFSDSTADGNDNYGIMFYTKLQKPVFCFESICLMAESARTNNEKASVLETVLSINPYTAVAGNGDLIWVEDEFEVLKLRKK